jgi:hypothetical protein
MRLAVVLALLFLSASVAKPQVEHAPTMAQCRADQRVWLSKIEEGDREQLPTFTVLSGWASEMNDCQKVDPTKAWSYNNAGGEIVAEQAARQLNFIRRHELYQRFIDEDAAGKR